MTYSEKGYLAKKPQSKPKKYPTPGGLDLFEDEIGWYIIIGEIDLNECMIQD